MQTSTSPRRTSLLALTVALACAAPPASAATNPLPGLFSDPGNRQLCFRRAYDKAHLRRHPRQRTTSMLVSLHPLDKSGESAWLKLRLHLKERPSPAPVGASCNWEARGANRDTSGNRIFPGYTREDGFICLALYSNQAAEEAGTLLLDLAPDGRSLMVYLDSPMGLWGTSPPEPGEPSKQLKLGADDRVFRLTRAEPAACRDMDQAIDIK